MAESLMVTPTDELTGLPLPIVPSKSLTDPEGHHHFHPRTAPRLISKQGGLALRNVRLQRVSYDTHHFGYHQFFEGPPLPKKMADRFGLVVMSVAGYMPDEALDFSDGEPRIVSLSDDQRLLLQTGGQIYVRNHSEVRRFVQFFVLSQGWQDTNINERTIEEFVLTTDDERRRTLGHNLLGLITEKATEQIDESYYQAYRRRQIRPGLPSSATRFTKALMGSSRYRDNMVSKLHERVTTSVT